MLFFLLEFPAYGYLTVNIGMIGILTVSGSDECDPGRGMDRFCDPYVKLTLTDGESKPEVHKTITVLNSAGYTLIDETIHFEKASNKAEILIEIYDSNENDVFGDDQLMFNRKMKVLDFVKDTIYGENNAKVLLNAIWRPEYQPTTGKVQQKIYRKSGVA